MIIMVVSFMGLVGFFVLVAGWIIVMAAIAMLHATPRTGFAIAGICVQLMGLTLAVRSHLSPREDKD